MKSMRGKHIFLYGGRMEKADSSLENAALSG